MRCLLCLVCAVVLAVMLPALLVITLLAVDWLFVLLGLPIGAW